MEIFRTSVTLLSLCLLHSSLSETQSICNAGNLPLVQHVALNSNVTIPCPIYSASEMDFKLYKGSEEIFKVSINNTSISKNDIILRKDFFVSFQVNDTTNSTSYILTSVTMNTTALYTCEATRHYPPPFQQMEHKPQTIVLVEGRPAEIHPGCQHEHLVLEVVTGVMGLYALIMTCFLLILRFKLKTPIKDRRKWQGVQHPTWKISDNILTNSAKNNH